MVREDILVELLKDDGNENGEYLVTITNIKNGNSVDEAFNYDNYQDALIGFENCIDYYEDEGCVVDSSNEFVEATVCFEASADEDLVRDIPGMNFMYQTIQLHQNGERVGCIDMEPAGDYDTDIKFEITEYWNNENGTSYTPEQFVEEFCGNSKYNMLGEHSTRDYIYLESVGAI